MLAAVSQVALLLGCSRGPSAPRVAPGAPGSSQRDAGGLVVSTDGARDASVVETEHTVGGARFRVSLATDAPSAFVGEPVYMTLEFFNPSAEPIELEMAWMGRNSLGRPENFTVRVEDPRGALLPTRDAGPSFGGRSWRQRVRAGERHAVRLLLAQWAITTAPGRHAVSVRTEITARTVGGADGVATIEARTALDVVPASADAMGALLERLERAASRVDGSKASEEASRALLFGGIRDPRIVDVFVRQAQRPLHGDSTGYLFALGSWNDDRAVAALERALRVTAADLDPSRYANDSLRQMSADSLRLSAAQALGMNEHPRAMTVLLTLRSDTNQSVRLTVMQRAAARLPRAQSEPIVRGMLDDRVEIVRGEAARLLRTLGDGGTIATHESAGGVDD